MFQGCSPESARWDRCTARCAMCDIWGWMNLSPGSCSWTGIMWAYRAESQWWMPFNTCHSPSWLTSVSVSSIPHCGYETMIINQHCIFSKLRDIIFWWTSSSPYNWGEDTEISVHICLLLTHMYSLPLTISPPHLIQLANQQYHIIITQSP